jgi:hypothetical protein
MITVDELGKMQAKMAQDMARNREHFRKLCGRALKKIDTGDRVLNGYPAF